MSSLQENPPVEGARVGPAVHVGRFGAGTALRLRCGNVGLEVRASGEVFSRVGPFSRRVRTFASEGPPDVVLRVLRLFGRAPKTGAALCGASGRIARFLERRPARPPCHGWDRRRIARFLAESGVEAPSGGPAGMEPGVLAVPLEAGFLWVDTNTWQAVLGLDVGDPSAGEGEWIGPSFSLLNAVMALLSFRLSIEGGVLVHGVAVRTAPDRGVLFAAPSGGGKTTLSTGFGAGSVLADDGVAVRRESTGYRAYPTPLRQRPGGRTADWSWCGESVSLKAAFVLGGEGALHVSHLSRADFVGAVLPSCTQFFHWMDRRMVEAAFDSWRDLARLLPTGRLFWRPGDDVQALVEAGEKKGGRPHVAER